jgi:hypothetical protein
VQDEINIEMGTDSKIYSSGIGFAGTDDVVNGFAESGKDFRVVVSVDESEFARYSAEFKEKFDDRVILEIGDPIFLDYGDGINNEQIVGTIDLVETGNRNGYLWILLLLVIGLPVMLILTRLRRKKVRPKEKISIEEQDLSRIHQV